jgi:outer membrane biosynthesis protein TonB
MSTPRTHTLRRRVVAVVGALALSLPLAACGGEESPRERVPEIGDQLDAVDDSLVDGELRRARAALRNLVAAAVEGRDDGRITAAELRELRQAARALARAIEEYAALEEPEEEPEEEPTPEPAPEPTPTPTPEPTPEPTPTPTPEPTPEPTPTPTLVPTEDPEEEDEEQ